MRSRLKHANIILTRISDLPTIGDQILEALDIVSHNISSPKTYRDTLYETRAPVILINVFIEINEMLKLDTLDPKLLKYGLIKITHLLSISDIDSFTTTQSTGQYMNIGEVYTTDYTATRLVDILIMCSTVLDKTTLVKLLMAFIALETLSGNIHIQ